VLDKGERISTKNQNRPNINLRTPSRLPLARFGMIDAADMNEAIQLVAGTPCARAKSVVELRPIARSTF
jgi:hypothetical protein